MPRILSPNWVVLLQESATTSFYYMLACLTLHFISSIVSPRIIPGFDFPHLSKEEKKETRHGWFNRTVSVTHAIIMFSCAIYYWSKLNPTREFSTNNNVGQHERNCLDIMMGYLWYDMIVEISSSAKLDTLSHHILGIASHMSSRLSDNHAAGYYSMLVYLAEISTPFLHTTWLMHYLKYDGIVFKLCVLVLLVTFLCRCCVGPYMVGHMLTYPKEWLREEREDDTGFNFLYWGNVLIVSMFALLNFAWANQLFRMIFKNLNPSAKDGKKSRSSKPSKKES